MKRFTTAAVLFFVISMTLAASTVMAATVYSNLDFSDNNPSAGQVINNVSITDTGSQYSINMLLNGTPFAGTSYSVLMSSASDGVFLEPSYSLDANAYNEAGRRGTAVLKVSFSGTDYSSSNPGLSFFHSTTDKTLTWIIDKNILFSGANFWFAGQSYKTGDLNTIYSQTKVAATPIPSAAWLLGTGILGLVGLSRRRRSAA